MPQEHYFLRKITRQNPAKALLRRKIMRQNPGRPDIPRKSKRHLRSIQLFYPKNRCKTLMLSFFFLTKTGIKWVNVKYTIKFNITGIKCILMSNIL
jgi:hypothetical protein